MPTDLRGRRSEANDGAPRTPSYTGKGKERAQGPMDRFVEPAVASGPSFGEQQGGMHLGVLENMQPLGEAPTAKIRAKLKLDKKASPAPQARAGGSGTDAQNTPESTPQPATRSTARVASPAKPSTPIVIASHTDSVPTEKRSQRARKQKEAVKEPISPGPWKERGTHRGPTPPPEGHRTQLPPGSEWTDEEIQGIVAEAKRQAVAKGEPDSADHVEEIYQMSRLNQRLHYVLVQVLSQKNTVEERKEFEKFTRQARKQVQKAKKTQQPPAVKPSDVARQIIKSPSPVKASLQSSSQATLAPAPAPPQNKAVARLKPTQKVAKETTSTKRAAHAAKPKPKAKPARKSEIIIYQPEQPRHAWLNDDPDFDTMTNGEIAVWHFTRDLEVPVHIMKKYKFIMAPKSTDDEEDAESSKAKSAAAEPEAANVRSTPSPENGPANQKPTQTKVNVMPSTVVPAMTNGVSGTTSSKASSPAVEIEGIPSTADISLLVEAEPATNGESTMLPEGGRGERAAAKKSRETTRAAYNATQHVNTKRTADDARLDTDEQDREFNAKKQKLTTGVLREWEYKDSNIRQSVAVSSPPRQVRQSSRIADTPKKRKSILADDDDSEISSIASATPPPPPPPPTNRSGGQRAKTKHSPEKKPTHAHSSLLGVRGARMPQESQPAYDGRSEAEASDNQDYCSACDGHGELLCCDGCDRAFHLECVDPPLTEASPELDEPWFCNVCKARRKREQGEPERLSRDMFTPLKNYLNKINPITFALPDDIRNHFDGVIADEDGNYARANRNGKKKINGAGELVDLYKMRDAKGQLLFCFHCKGTSEYTKQVVQCDDCAQLWHLDCLPQEENRGVHPQIDGEGRKAHEWLCPLHAEHDLRAVETARIFASRASRKMQVRKPRRVKRQEAFLPRGTPNTGLIDVIEEESSSDDDSEFELVDDPVREDVILKLPAEGIKLDFIEAIKQSRIQKYHDDDFTYRMNAGGQGRAVCQTQPAWQAAQRRTTNALGMHSIQEQQAAFNLAQFAQADRNRDLGLSNDGVETLLAAVVAEAPAQIVDKVDVAAKKMQRGELLKLHELIKRQLASL